MARKLITQELVFNAASEIVRQGEKPTVLTVHKLLGRGSFSTVTKYLKLWEESSEAAEARVDSLPKETTVPDALSSDTEALVKKLWTAAKSIADEQLTIERHTLEEAKAQYQAEVEQAIDLADQATEKHEELTELFDEASEKYKSELMQLNGMMAEEKQKNAVHEQDKERFRAIIKDQSVTLERLTEEQKLQSEELAVKKSDIERLKTQAEEQNKSLNNSKMLLEAANNEVSTLKTSLATKDLSLAHLEEKRQVLERNNTLLEASAAESKNEITTLNALREKAITEVVTERTKVESLTAQLTKYEKQQAELQKQLFNLAKDKK